MCISDDTLIILCNAKNCDYCKGNDTTVECFCPDGYTLNANGTTCDGKHNTSLLSH